MYAVMHRAIERGKYMNPLPVRESLLTSFHLVGECRYGRYPELVSSILDHVGLRPTLTLTPMSRGRLRWNVSVPVRVSIMMVEAVAVEVGKRADRVSRGHVVTFMSV